MKKPTLLVLLITVLAIGASAQPASDISLRQKVFQTVWSTVNKEFYDAKFNGVDWQAVHDKYLPVARAAASDDELYNVINEMLSLLKVSHMEAGPASKVQKFSAKAAATGLGLRMVEGRLTITRLLPGFPAEKAGLKLGYVITAIDDAAVSEIEDAKVKLAGPAGTTVKITYLDEKDVEHESVVERMPLSDNDHGDLGGLNLYALFYCKQLEGGIGYISFTSFVPFLNNRIHAAFGSMKNAPGLILDLRGNGGGDDEVAIRIANRLFDKPTLLMVTRKRVGEDLYYKAKPAQPIYRGKLVILVDEFSGSASEQLTAGLQESGRAYVIGKSTAGEDLDANIKMLPDGGMLVYAYGLPVTPKGIVIEGRGVIPDLTVDLKRSELLAGKDTQLQAAIAYLQKK
jgi:carboxyl-terminal processing protease